MLELKCPYCSKVVTGYSEEHCQKMLDIHIVSKHRDLVSFGKVKDIRNINTNVETQ